MAVLRRNMFRGGGYAHRGTGITTGLTPVRGYANGGKISGTGGLLDWDENDPDVIAGKQMTEDRPSASQAGIINDYEDYLKLLKRVSPSERKPFNKWKAASPALLALGSKLLSGKSYQGGWSGGLDILGQAAGAAVPGIAQAAEARREYDAADPEADLRMKALEMAIENQPDPDKPETFTGKELVTGKVPVIENGINTGKFETVKATRLVGNQGTVMYKDSQNNTLENFVPSLDPATKPDDPLVGQFKNEKFITKDNPNGIVSAQFVYDKDEDRWKWMYNNPVDNEFEEMPMVGSEEISITGTPGDYEPSENKARVDLQKSEINTRNALGVINRTIDFISENPAANTIIGSVASFTSETLNEVQAAFNAMGIGKLESPSVLDVNNPEYQEIFNSPSFLQLGEASAIAKSKLLTIAYMVAAAEDQTGKALSDKDVAKFMKIAGVEYGKGKTMVAVLNSVKENLGAKYTNKHNVYARDYEGINPVDPDYILNPIGSKPNKLVDPTTLTPNQDTEVKSIIDAVEGN